MEPFATQPLHQRACGSCDGGAVTVSNRHLKTIAMRRACQRGPLPRGGWAAEIRLEIPRDPGTGDWRAGESDYRASGR
jgi:hypothetical protein